MLRRSVSAPTTNMRWLRLPFMFLVVMALLLTMFSLWALDGDVPVRPDLIRPTMTSQAGATGNTGDTPTTSKTTTTDTPATKALDPDAPCGGKTPCVAVVVTVIKDKADSLGADGKSGTSGKEGWGDSLALFAWSVQRLQSQYYFDLVTLVTPEVKVFRPLFASFGFRVIERPIPFTAVNVTGTSKYAKVVKEKLTTDGCCGPAELLKLWAFELTQYDKVMMLDADMILRSNVDAILSRPETVIYTRALHASMQGGFMVITPQKGVMGSILEVLANGDFRYGGEGYGWEGTGIGFNYGGLTIQGVVPFYFQRKAKPGHTHLRVLAPIWDNEVYEPRDIAVPYEDVKIVHFTFCHKPWYCWPITTDYCANFTDEWWATRRQFEHFHGLEETHGCSHSGYAPLKFPPPEAGKQEHPPNRWLAPVHKRLPPRTYTEEDLHIDPVGPMESLGVENTKWKNKGYEIIRSKANPLELPANVGPKKLQAEWEKENAKNPNSEATKKAKARLDWAKHLIANLGRPE